MQQRYTLPVSAILQTLRDQHNGMTALSASLPSVPGYQQDEGQVVLILGQGHVQTCMIRSRTGLLLLQGGEALKALEQLGNLEWQVQGFRGRGDTPSLERSTGSDSACSQEHLTDQSIPRRRVAALSPEQQQNLSRRHRQVFALIDGTRNVASIATLLHLSSEEVARLLHDLHQDQLLD
jgi:hypothetical protein